MTAVEPDRSAGPQDPTARALRTVALLTELSSLDGLHADLYRERARILLSEVCSRAQYLGLLAERQELDRLVSALGRAVERGEWRLVQSLAHEAGRLRGRVQGSARTRDVAASVYEVQPLVARPLALSLAGIGTLPADSLRDQIASLVRDLHLLAELDRAHAAFYASRARHFAGTSIDVDSDLALRISPETLLSTLREAATRHDFEQVESLATSAAEEGRDVQGRLRPSRPSEELQRRLRAPILPAAVDAARRLGLEARSLPAAPALESYLACACSDRAVLLDARLEPGRRPVGACTCGHPCPPGVRPTLRDTLDLLLGHVFVSSAGARYLPWFGAEELLVEPFGEDLPEPAGPLLERLGLGRRVGLSPVAVEAALLDHGAGICRDLGLDPLEFRLVRIPFDAYLRLAPELGWGRTQRWTHLDGHQMKRDLKLLGLVGGDARYGGPDDLCSVAGEYESERVLLRLAIVRRARLAVRAGGG